MRIFEKLFYFLFPLTVLKATPWENLWKENEKADFLKVIRIFFYITCAGYILHYHTVDVAEGLAPSKLWFNYRYGMAAISLACVVYYTFPRLYNLTRFYRLPAIVATVVFCYFQAMTCIWYAKVPYLYAFAFILASVTVLRTSVLKSVAVGLIMGVAVGPVLLKAGVSPAMVFSGLFFSIAVLVFSRTKYAADLRYFIATQKNMDQQRHIIQMNMEFTDQVKSFLPQEISNRLVDCIQQKRLGVSQAVHQVLAPRKQDIVCLFSDIRGFTKNSNDLNGFVAESMFPEVIACTKAIEEQRGISRKVGDLLFAYFDTADLRVSVELAIAAAVNISSINKKMNSQLNDSKKIKRFILLSQGEAMVGNLSGYASSIEITAIGRPVNLLSRIDELTKKPGVHALLESGDIIFCDNMLPYFESMFPKQWFTTIDLKKLDLKVRDFEEIGEIYVYRPLQSLSQFEEQAAGDVA